MSVLAILEQRDGKWNRMSFEALTAAKAIAEPLGLPVHAVVLSGGSNTLPEEIAAYGVDTVFSVEHALLAEYSPDGYTAALAQLLQAQQPRLVVFPHTYQVRDYAPKLATRLGQRLVSDVVAISARGTDILAVRQLFQGKLNVDVLASGSPAFVSIQAGAFRALQAGAEKAAVEKFAPEIEVAQVRGTSEPPFREAQRSVDLNAADIIVSVGRGIKEQSNMPIVENLATALGAELAASRPICDNGWLPMERQVGSSGQTVSPKVYLAVGISGAIQHLVGMKGSHTVVAINKDENAPIFETADYALVGDLFEIVPALTEEVRKAKA